MSGDESHMALSYKWCEDVRIWKGFLPLMFDFDVLWNILLVAQKLSFSLKWNQWSAGVWSRREGTTHRCFCLQTSSINTNHSLTKLTNRLLWHAQPRSVHAHVFTFDLSVRLRVRVCLCVCMWSVFVCVSWDWNSLEGMLQLEQKYKMKWDHWSAFWLAVETKAGSKASSCLILNLQTRRHRGVQRGTTECQSEEGKGFGLMFHVWIYSHRATEVWSRRNNFTCAEKLCLKIYFPE